MREMCRVILLRSNRSRYAGSCAPVSVGDTGFMTRGKHKSWHPCAKLGNAYWPEPLQI